MAKILLNTSTTGVTTSANTASTLTTIFEFKVPAELKYTIYAGRPWVMKLKDSGGNEIDAHSKIVVLIKGVTDEVGKEVGKFLYRNWHEISLSNQYNSKFRDALVPDLKGHISLREEQKFIIQLNSPDVVDWSNSVIEIEAEEERLM